MGFIALVGGVAARRLARFHKEAEMTRISRAVLALVAIAPLVAASGASAQTLPNPYRLVENWAQIPTNLNGGKWGEVIGVKSGPDGSIWVLHRCFNVVPPGSATCVGRDDMPPIMKFDPSGKLLESFGQGLLAFPHGFHIDGEGNIWVTDANNQATVLGLSAKGRGHQVFKLDPHGKVLLTLGKAGVAGKGHDTFDRPTDVAIGNNGDIFVTDGHSKNDRVIKFTKDGHYIKEWGRTGSGPGEFNQPHALDIDPQGRIFVADRSNNRLQMFDQDGLDDARNRLAAVRTQSPQPTEAQSQFISGLSFGFVDPSRIRMGLVALSAVMVEVCATLGLFAAVSHSFQKPTVPNQKPSVHEAAQRKPKAW